MKVTGHIERSYDTHEVPCGKVYAWRPGRKRIECDCGEKLNFTDSTSVCGCGVYYAAILQETLVAKRARDGDLHPWRYAGDREDASALLRELFDETD
jgi:hypothetical protein